MSNEMDNWESLGLAGSLASQYARDARGFLPLLASVLEASMPELTGVTRKGGLFQKQKPIVKVAVTLGEDIYTLEDTGRGPLAATRIKVVRGIALKTEPMPTEDWLAALSAEISSRAEGNERAFFALRDLLD